MPFSVIQGHQFYQWQNGFMRKNGAFCCSLPPNDTAAGRNSHATARCHNGVGTPPPRRRWPSHGRRTGLISIPPKANPGMGNLQNGGPTEWRTQIIQTHVFVLCARYEKRKFKVYTKDHIKEKTGGQKTDPKNWTPITYSLPQCIFTPPPGHFFRRWQRTRRSAIADKPRCNVGNCWQK